MVCPIASLSCSYTTFEDHLTFWKGAGEQNVVNIDKSEQSIVHNECVVSNGSVASYVLSACN